MRDRKTRDSCQDWRSLNGKRTEYRSADVGESAKAPTSERTLKDLGPRTSKDRETERRKTRKTTDLCYELPSPTNGGPRDRSADVGESRKAPTSERTPKRTTDFGIKRPSPMKKGPKETEELVEKRLSQARTL